MKAATSTAPWKTEEKIPSNTRRGRIRHLPGRKFHQHDEETQKALEEVDANRNETDLKEETQKALEEIDANQNEIDLDEKTKKALEEIDANTKLTHLTNRLAKKWCRAALKEVFDLTWCRAALTKLKNPETQRWWGVWHPWRLL